MLKLLSPHLLYPMLALSNEEIIEVVVYATQSVIFDYGTLT